MIESRAELLDAALSAAARGWHVFPCLPGRKQPALRVNWQEIATTDPARIQSWWNQTAYNIGIACGPSGLIVIDLDVPRPGVDQTIPNVASGAQSLAELCIQHDEPYPSNTMVVQTPSGGYHLYYQSPQERIPNSAGKLAPRVDVRGIGGYVIAHGSRTSQGAYKTIRPRTPAPLPAWIGKLARQPDSPLVRHADPRPISDGSAYANAVLGYETETVASATQGNRNDTLFKSSRSLGQLVAGGILNADAVRVALTRAAEATGLGRVEITRTIESGLKSGARMPRGRPHSDSQPVRSR